MKAKSIKGNSTEDIKASLKQNLTNDFKPTLAFVFMSVKHDIAAVQDLFDKEGITIFGATSSGEFIDGQISSEGIVVLLLDMNPAHFRVFVMDYMDQDPELVAIRMTKDAMDIFKEPSFLISYGTAFPTDLVMGEAALSGIQKVAGKEAVIWGGVAGDDLKFSETFVFSNQKILNSGILMLVVDSNKVLIKGQSSSGWKAVGTEKTITKSVNNWVYTIDDQPAADMVIKYLGLELSKETAEKFNPGITVFSIMRKTGEPVMRSSGVFNWEDRSILISGSIQEGDKLRLTLPPDFETVDKVIKDAAHFKQTELNNADALVMFSCVGRHAEFGPMTSEEIDGIKNIFGVPMAGFFCYGEYGRATNGNNEFHNMTCCWVGLKEK